MIVFATSNYYRRFIRALRTEHPDIAVGTCDISRFPNGEMHASVDDDVSGQDCLIIGSVAPPDEQIMALFMLANALKGSGAHLVQVFLPYLGYARQDKFKPGESRGIALIGSLLHSAGVDKVITVDTHSKLDAELIGLPFTSLSAATLFIPEIQSLDWDNATIVAPDEGAISRSQAVANTLGSTRPVAHLVKKHIDGIVHLNLVSEVGARVVIVDDIIDSGRTLVSACNVLRDKGVQEITVIVTHGLFTGSAWKRLFGLGVKTLFVSDSCPEAVRQKHPSAHVISLAPLLSAVLTEAAKREKQYENAVT
jgi:ribose-phosphate pyrophosphokinase